MNKIYAIMVVEKIAVNEKLHMPDFGCSQVVGWYSKFDRAYLSVSRNSCDINETCYKYAIIEECEEGLYNPSFKRWWFEYNSKENRYFEIDEPDFMKKIHGFTF